jgi:hypothetical protein
MSVSKTSAKFYSDILAELARDVCHNCWLKNYNKVDKRLFFNFAAENKLTTYVSGRNSYPNEGRAD